MSGGDERHFGFALGGEMWHLAPVCFLFTIKRTLQAFFSPWREHYLFPVHHEENPASFLVTMKRTLQVSCSPWREPGSFLFTMKRTLQASCSQQRELWMHLSITMMLSFQVLWMSKTRNSDQKHPSSLMLSCRVLLSLNEKVWLIRFFTHLSLHLLWASPLGVVNLFNFPL